MKLDFFTFDEFVRTSQKVDNIPNWEQVENLFQLRVFLNTVRHFFGKAIRVNSAFRSPELNAAVGGSKTSMHVHGLAADICAFSGTEADNRQLLRILESLQPGIDQLISYHKTAGNVNTPIRFIHVGLSKWPESPRGQRLVK